MIWIKQLLSMLNRAVDLGHKAQHVTTHHSAPEIGALIATAERIWQLEALAIAAISIARARAGRLR